MDTGKVKKIIEDRGFGFIMMADGREVFFHRSECRNTTFDKLIVGKQVNFTLEMSDKGLRAINISV